MTNSLKEVLLSYNIKPIVISRVTSKLYHVRDGIQEYALKKSSLDDEMIQHWEAIHRFAHTKQLSTVLPVYITRDGKLSYRTNEAIYYVSPWIDVPRDERDNQWITNFYTSLGKLHSSTKRTYKIEIEKISEQFLDFQGHCQRMRNHLQTLITQFESNRYMSPIELLVCTQYRDIEKAFLEIDKRIQRFINDHENGHIEWSAVLCHGNLSASNVRGTFFVNWESARMDHPSIDLIHFFRNEIGKFDPNDKQYIDLFSTYTDFNKFSLQELQYFAIYMLSPTSYINYVQDYVKNVRNKSMTDWMKILQHEYRRILFGLSWSEYIDKEYETFNLDDLEL